MSENEPEAMVIPKSRTFWIFIVLVAIGVVTFIVGLTSQHPERAWQAYLINFLLWSAIAQGAVLFSAVMHMTKARWSGPLSSLSESLLPNCILTKSLIMQRHLFYITSRIIN